MAKKTKRSGRRRCATRAAKSKRTGRPRSQQIAAKGVRAKQAAPTKRARAGRSNRVKPTGSRRAKPVRPTPVSLGRAVRGKGTASGETQEIRDQLLRLRERITGQISSLADDSLKYIDDSSSEDRTDDFDREFVLNLVSSEHDAIFEIDEALRRIQEGTYGVCVGCSRPIERVRLKALPFARMCVACQSESERGRTRFRPFGDTLAQGTERSADSAEPEESE
jgi:RNA polymerase-binding transcription factor DksA